MLAAKELSAPFRSAGLTYVQYLGISSRAMRSCLKEPIKAKAISRENLFYHKVVTGQPKEAVTSFMPKAM